MGVLITRKIHTKGTFILFVNYFLFNFSLFNPPFPMAEISLFEIKKFFEKFDEKLTKEEKENLKLIFNKIEGDLNNLKEKSIELKNKGNDFYSKGLLDEALEMYTLSIEADPTNYLVYSNRSLIYYKLKQNEKSIQDCLDGIEIEPSFVKFYIRLATIYSEMASIADDESSEKYVELTKSNIEKGLSYEQGNTILLGMKKELNESVEMSNPLDSFDPATMDSLLKNKNLQDMVQGFVKDKSPEELNDMISKVLGNFNKKK
jgi:tetratricopeptide (TPR) repeat protein